MMQVLNRRLYVNQGVLALDLGDVPPADIEHPVEYELHIVLEAGEREGSVEGVHFAEGLRMYRLTVSERVDENGQHFERLQEFPVWALPFVFDGLAFLERSSITLGGVFGSESVS